MNYLGYVFYVIISLYGSFKVTGFIDDYVCSVFVTYVEIFKNTCYDLLINDGYDIIFILFSDFWVSVVILRKT